MADELLSLTDAADHLGVHYMTAYRYVRTGRLPATKVGTEWRVAASDVEAMRTGRPGASRVGGPPSEGPGHGRRRRRDYHTRLERRLLAGDEAGAWTIIETALTAGLEPAEVYLQVLAPAMARIGDGWAAGTVSIAAEHRASVIVLRLIGRMGPRFTRRGRKRGTIVLGAPPGDHHSVPLALASDLLRGASFAVVDLGADTPTVSFVDAGRSAERLVGVGINATTSGNQRAIEETVAAVHRELGCPVVLGGQAIVDRPSGAALGADVVTGDALELLEVFEGLTGNRHRPT